ncbi:beta strand repeat-containing protein [Alicyclobacillus sp. ALC3]|uniref:beta strand repeat-containing protein n=1 Tax=Alicyclobacillus sp. ALC3 TaxID=2796143 RepID=UPI0023787D10|nr:hypothetical protein [Alicyclobacillus sp. ALC3]WDL97274.1 hypothetical protein JC200_00475 [Alicyclobacillus sp. ALC3]
MRKARHVLGPVVALSTLLAPIAIPQASASTTQMGQMQLKNIAVNGTVVSQVYGFAAIDPSTGHYTEYMPVWYIQRAMAQVGLKSQWDGVTRILNITEPNSTIVVGAHGTPGQSAFKVYVNGKYVTAAPEIVRPDPSSGIDTTYIPIWYVKATLDQLQVPTTWNGYVLNLSGTVQASSTKSSISTSASHTVAGQSVTVFVKPNDVLGAPLGSGQTVEVSDGAGNSKPAVWNAANNDYEATFTETTAQTYTFSATVDGVALQQTAPLTVSAANVSASVSTVSAPATATAGSGVVVHVVPKDQYGNELMGQTVNVFDGTTTKAAVWNATSKDYEVTFNESTVGTYTFTTTINGTQLDSQPQTVVSAGSISSQTTVTAASTSVTAGNSNVAISVVPKDANGNPLGSGQQVTVSDGTTTETATWNATNNDYEVQFSETKAGSYTFTATVNSTLITNTANVTVNPAAVNAGTSLVSASGGSVAGSPITVSVVPEDAFNNKIGSGQTVTVSDGTQTKTATWNATNGDYEATFTENTAGKYTFVAAMNGVTLSEQPTVTQGPGAYSSQSTVTASSNSVTVGNGNVSIAVVLRDSNGNVTALQAGQTLQVSDGMGQTAVANPNPNGTGYIANFSELKPGVYTYTASVVQGNTTTTLSEQPQVTVNQGSLDASNSTIMVSQPNGQQVGNAIDIKVYPKDQFGNVLTGQTITVTDQNGHSWSALWVQNGNSGYYEVSNATEMKAGQYTFTATDQSASISNGTNTATVTPGDAASMSTVSGPQGEVTAGDNNVVITVTPRDSQGNLLGNGQTVLVGIQGTGTSTWQQATYAGNGQYTYTFTDHTAGTFTYAAMVGSKQLSNTAKVNVVAGALDTATSTFTIVNGATQTAGQPFTVMLSPVDQYGNSIGSNKSIAISDGKGQTVFATWNGTEYTATFTENTVGTYNLTANVAGQTMTTSVQVNPGAFSASGSTISSTPSGSVTAGNPVTVTVVPRDANGNPLLASQVQSVTITDQNGNSYTSTSNPGSSTYSITVNETKAGPDTFTATITPKNGPAQILTYTVNVLPGAIDQATSKLSATYATPLQVGNPIHLQLTLQDANNNGIDASGVVVYDQYGQAFPLTETAQGSGVYTGTATESTAGSYTFTTTVNGDQFSTGQIQVAAGNASVGSTVSGPQQATAGNSFTITVTPQDASGNLLGSDHTVMVGVQGTSQSGWTQATYAGNGQYTATFTEDKATSYTFAASVDGGAALSSTATVNVVPAALDTTYPSSFVVGSGSGAPQTAGQSFTISLNPVDQYGNSIGSNLNISVTDGNGQTLYPTWNNGAYTATLTENTAGTYKLTAYVAGQTMTANFTVVAGAYSANGSTITATPSGTVTAGNSVTVTVVPRDANGNPLQASQVKSVTMTDTNKEVSSTTSTAGSSTYSTTVKETQAGTDTFTATITLANGQVQTLTYTVNVLPAAISTSNSSLTAMGAAPLLAGSPINLTLTLKDGYLNPVTVPSIIVTDQYGHTFALTETAANSGVYTGTAMEMNTGTYTFSTTVDGVQFAAAPVTVSPGSASSLSTIEAPTNVIAGQNNFTMTITPRDSNGTLLGNNQSVQVSSNGTTWAYATNNGDGTYTYETSLTTATNSGNPDTFYVKVGGVVLSNTATVNVLPGLTVPSNSTVAVGANQTAGQSFNVTFTPNDKYLNPVGQGHTVMIADQNNQQWTATWNGSAYVANVTEDKAGNYTFTAYIQGTSTMSQSVTVNPGAVAGANVTYPTSNVAAGSNNVPISVVPIDAYGNVIPASAIAYVQISDGTNTHQIATPMSGAYSWTFSENAEKTYTYTITIVPTTGNNVVMSETVNVVSPAATTVSSVTTSAPGTTTPVSQFTAGANVQVNVSLTGTNNDPVTGTLPNGYVLTIMDSAGQKATAHWNSAAGAYIASFTETHAGTVTYTATLMAPNGSTTQGTGSTLVVPAAVDTTNSSLALTGGATYLVTDQTSTLLLALKDQYGNPINGLTAADIMSNMSPTTAQFTNFQALGNGQYSYDVTTTANGNYTFTESVAYPTGTTTPFTINLSSNGNVNNISTSSTLSVNAIETAGQAFTVTGNLVDANGNVITNVGNPTIYFEDSYGTTEQATWNGTAWQATFNEPVGHVSFSAVGTNPTQMVMVTAPATTYVIPPTMVGAANNVLTAVPGVDTLPGVPLQMMNSGSTTLTTTYPSDPTDTAPIPFYDASNFGTVSPKSFMYPVTQSAGYAGQPYMWFGGNGGGANPTNNGLSFFLATVYESASTPVTVTLKADDVAMAYVNGVPTAFSTDISGYGSAAPSSNFPNSSSVMLKPGYNQILVEAANAGVSTSNNPAGVSLSVLKSGSNQTVIDTSSSYLSDWMTTGYTINTPTFWYSNSQYDLKMSEYMLNPTTATATQQYSVYPQVYPLYENFPAVVTHVSYGPNTVTVQPGTTATALEQSVGDFYGSVNGVEVLRGGQVLPGNTVLQPGDIYVVSDGNGSVSYWLVQVG